MAGIGARQEGGQGSQESGLLQRLRRQLEAVSPRPRDVCIGYSGGADSLALLALLANLQRLGELERLTAIHVDHGVRSASGADATIAREVAGRLGVPVEVRAVDPVRLAGHTGVGLEEALRRERYLVFAEALAGSGAGMLALAHHQRDQAETVLLHLLRGSGLQGVTGMRVRSEMRVPWWDDGADTAARALRVWRPLLAEPAAGLEAFARGLGLPVAVDASNADVSFRRNAIRHEALPVLERIAPGATANLARFAALAGADADLLDAMAAETLLQVRGGGGLRRQDLAVQPVAIARRVVRQWIAAAGPPGLEVSLNRVDEVLRVAAVPGPPRTVEIGMGVAVRVEASLLLLEFSRP